MYSDGIESYEEKTSTELIKFDDKKESFMTIELSNRVALVDEISFNFTFI